jgi:hypothetical protein
MLLPLTVKIGEVRHGQHCWVAAWRAAEQRGLKPVVIPLRSKRPRDLGSFGRCKYSWAVLSQSSNSERSAVAPGAHQTSIEELL